MRRHRLQATSRAVWAISIVALCITVLLGGTARAGVRRAGRVRSRRRCHQPGVGRHRLRVHDRRCLERHAHPERQAGAASGAARRCPTAHRWPSRSCSTCPRQWIRRAALAAAKDEAKQWLRGLNAAEASGRTFAVVLRGRDRRAAAGLHERHQPRHRRHRQGRTGEHRGNQEVDGTVVRHPPSRQRSGRRERPSQPVRLRRPGPTTPAAAMPPRLAVRSRRPRRPCSPGSTPAPVPKTPASRRSSTTTAVRSSPRPTAPVWVKPSAR